MCVLCDASQLVILLWPWSLRTLNPVCVETTVSSLREMAELTRTQRRMTPLKTWQMKQFQWTRFQWSLIIPSGRVPWWVSQGDFTGFELTAGPSGAQMTHSQQETCEEDRKANKDPQLERFPPTVWPCAAATNYFWPLGPSPVAMWPHSSPSLTEIFYQMTLIERVVLCFSVLKR